MADTKERLSDSQKRGIKRTLLEGKWDDGDPVDIGFIAEEYNVSWVILP